MPDEHPPPCQSNCEFGTYNPETYDGSQCGCQKCPNFRLCQTWAPPGFFNCHKGVCMNCAIIFRKTLTFQNKDLPEDCPICLQPKQFFVNHPADAMCFQCFKEQWMPEREVLINPRSHGFQTQCTCEECGDENDFPCDDAMMSWKATKPRAYLRWSRIQDFEQQRLNEKLDSRAQYQSCPICRKHLHDAPNNSW